MSAADRDIRPATSTPAPAVFGRGWVSSAWLPFAVAFVWGASSLGNQFTYDDRPMVVLNERIRSLSDVSAIWLSDYWEQTSAAEPILDPKRDRLYRPLTLVTFALDYALAGTRPFAYHLTNVLLHALVCVLLFQVARWILGSAAAAMAAALLFAVHPVHAEAVAGVVGRAELLATAGMLGGLLVVLRRERLTPGRALGAGGLLLAGLLAKETAVCFPLVVIVVLAWMGRLKRAFGESGAWLVVVLAAPLVVYLPLRYVALDGQLIRAGAVNVILNPLFEAEGMERVWGALAVLGHYTRMLLVPVHLSADYGLAVIDPSRGVTGMTIVGGLAVIGLFVALTGLGSRRPLRRTLAYGAVLFVVSYALISNTVLLIGVSAAERLMYWPSVALCLALGAVFVALQRRPSGAARSGGELWRMVGLGVLIVFGVRGSLRNLEWYNDEVLFSTDAQTTPQSVQIQACSGHTQIYLAVDVLRRPSRDEFSRDEFEQHLHAAERALDAALAITSRHPMALRERGHAYWLEDDLDSALDYLLAALVLDPTDRLTNAYLARFEQQLVSPERLVELRRSIAADPEDLIRRLQLVEALLHSGQPREALDAAAAAYERAPDTGEVARMYGEALLANLRYDEALRVLQKAVALAPNDWRIHANLAQLLSEKDAEAALLHARRAYELAPGDLRARTNYAEALVLVGRKAEALKIFGELEALLPDGHPMKRAVAERMAELAAE